MRPWGFPVRRTSRFWYRNEKEVMEGLGLTPTMGSGSGTLEKEDGYSDNVLCQLKSTESRSLTVHVEDVEKLAYHAAVEHKAPVFALNFEGTVGVWLMVRPKDIEKLD